MTKNFNHKQCYFQSNFLKKGANLATNIRKNEMFTKENHKSFKKGATIATNIRKSMQLPEKNHKSFEKKMLLQLQTSEEA